MAELRLYRVGWLQTHRWVPSAIAPASQIGPGTEGRCWIFCQIGTQLLQIIAHIHIVPLRQPMHPQLQAPAGVKGLGNYLVTAPGNIFKQFRLQLFHSDKIVAAVMAHPQGDVIMLQLPEGFF